MVMMMIMMRMKLAQPRGGRRSSTRPLAPDGPLPPAQLLSRLTCSPMAAAVKLYLLLVLRVAAAQAKYSVT